MENEYPEAVYSFEASGNIFDMVFARNEAPLVARLRPVRNREVEVEPLRNMLSEVRETLPGVTVADPPVKTDALFVADPDLLALYDVGYSELVSILRNSLNENRLFNIVQGTSTVPVVTGSNAAGLSEILHGTFIEKKGLDGETSRIPVSNLMRQTFAEDLKTLVAGPEDNYYPLALDVPSKDVKHVMAAVSDVVRKNGDFEVGYSGSWFSNSKMIDEMIIIMLVAIILLYLILASQFESLVQPLIILSEIVVDVFVALLVLWIFGVSINLMSMIGLIVITGIVINDSILKIDTINRMRKAGESLERAVIDASSLRVKAIIMTSLTTILAVCPFLSRGSMGADLQYPMSLVIIAGMLVGTLVSLFVVPALYYSIYNGRKKNRLSPFSVVLIMVALSLVGLASLPRLNIQYTPMTEGRTVYVSFIIPTPLRKSLKARRHPRLKESWRGYAMSQTFPLFHVKVQAPFLSSSAKARTWTRRASRSPRRSGTFTQAFLMRSPIREYPCLAAYGSRGYPISSRAGSLPVRFQNMSKSMFSAI